MKTQYKIMANRFVKGSTCSCSGVVMPHGSRLFYVPATKRAYAPTSKTAADLMAFGECIADVFAEMSTAKPVTAAAKPVTAPKPAAVMAQTLTAAKPSVPSAETGKSVTVTVRPTANGRWVWIPN